MNRSLLRIFSLILSAAILFSVLVVPAAASSYDGASDVTDTYWYNVLEESHYTPENGAGNVKTVSTSATSVGFTYSTEVGVNFSAFDLVLKSNGTISSVSFRGLTFDAVRLGTPDSDSNLYRVYGTIDGTLMTFPFTVNISGATYVEFVQFRLLTAPQYSFPAPASLFLDNGMSTYSFSDSTGYSSLGTFFTVNDIGQEDPLLWNAEIRSYDWYKYDTLEFYIRCRLDLISYITVESESGDISFPYSVSYIKNDSAEFSWLDQSGALVSSTYNEVEAIISVDVSGVPHDNENLNYYPVLKLGGQWFTQWVNNDGPVRYFYLDYVRGYVKYQTYDSVLWRLSQIYTYVKTWLYTINQSIKTWGQNIVDALNPEVQSMTDAAESQMEVNVQVNTMVSDSIAEWDTYHVQVSDGAEEGIQKAMPAFSWLSSIADGIFTQMGWFGNMYLFVGACSAFFLILSKSGIAHKISSAARSYNRSKDG